MKKSLLNAIAIIIALLMIAGCPDPVNTPTPETPEQPLDTTTPAKPTQPPSSINPGTPTQPTDPTTPNTPEETVTSVNYTVKHMKQDVTGNGYTEDTDARQTLSGTPGGTTAAQSRSFTGFTAKTFSQATIAEDGSTIVTINYDRNVHSVSYSATTSGVTAPAAASYRFGAQVTVQFPTGISAWSGNGTSYSATRNTFTMPDSDVVLSETYTITASNVAETLTTLPDNDAAAPYTLVVSDSADLTAIAQAISGSDIYVTLSLENCEGLTSLTDGMFQGCDNLASITLPENLSSIGDNAFKGCTGLTNIVIPETVASVGSDIFSGCTNLESVTFSGSVSSSCVAEIIDELPQGAVIEAADTAALASVIQGINSSNSSVSLSLENCTGLTTLADNAFQGCDNLSSITLPASVTSISGTAFSGCSALTSITVSPDNNSYSSEDGTLLGNSGTTLICCPEGKTSVTIPDTVTSIGNNAFDGCTGLTNIVIPETVTSVGSDIFPAARTLSQSLSQAAYHPHALRKLLTNFRLARS